MIEFSFKNDYSEGAHPKVLEALIETNMVQSDGYGDDPYTRAAADLIREKIDCKEAIVRFTAGGTQTNLLAISQVLRPHQAVISADSGHINVHEAGAIEGTGHKVEICRTNDGKITTEMIQGILDVNNCFHYVEPKMIYISNPTEIGTLYSKDELATLSKFCREKGLYVFLDGARMPSALAAEGNDLKLTDYPKYCDMFYLGGTKCGTLFGEVLVFVDPKLHEGFEYYIKQRGALMAKGRILGVQFKALFSGNTYYEIGEHSNKMAMKLKKCFRDNGFDFLFESYTNQQFPLLPVELIEELGKIYNTTNYELRPCNKEGHLAMRFVTSWATPEENVDKFVKDFTNLCNK